MIHFPRSTGEVVVPFAVTFKTLAVDFTATIGAAIDRGQRHAARPGLHFHQWQIAEQQPIACRGSLVGERPFHFHPAKRHARRAVLFHQRIDEPIGSRAIESRGIGHQSFAREQPHLAEVVDRRLGREIERTHAAIHQPVASVNRDRFIAAPGGKLVVVRQLRIRRTRRARRRDRDC